MMSTPPALKNTVRNRRIARGWSQQELAERAGVARASISAIEIERLVPSTSAALALAAALDCKVEDLFQLSGADRAAPEWAWQPKSLPTRYWQATVRDRPLVFPQEASFVGTMPHDGVAYDIVTGGDRLESRVDSAPTTLVMACCDPAVGLLAGELSRQAGVRLLPLVRSSRQALALLKQGLVHMAGLHLGPAGSDANRQAVLGELGPGYQLVHLAEWEEGIVTGDRRFKSPRAAVNADLRWVGREAGSGAAECLNQILGARKPPRHVAHDHRGVAEAVRSGWAEAGVCLRLTGEEAGLNFLSVRREAYDLCYASDTESDPRIKALLNVLRSHSFRRQLDDLPGYRAVETGSITPVT